MCVCAFLFHPMKGVRIRGLLRVEMSVQSLLFLFTFIFFVFLPSPVSFFPHTGCSALGRGQFLGSSPQRPIKSSKAMFACRNIARESNLAIKLTLSPPLGNEYHEEGDRQFFASTELLA